MNGRCNVVDLRKNKPMKKFLLPVSCCKLAKWKDPCLGWSRHYGVIALRDRCDVLVARDCSWDYYVSSFCAVGEIHASELSKKRIIS